MKNNPKEGKKRGKQEQRINGRNRKQKDGRSKPNHINDNIKYKWSKHTTKRQRFSGWIKKQDPTIFTSYIIHFKYRHTKKLKGWKKMYCANIKIRQYL